MKYKERYGAWAGMPEGRAPDFSKCAREVWRNFLGSQCRNTARFDPDENGNPTTCDFHRDKGRETK